MRGAIYMKKLPIAIMTAVLAVSMNPLTTLAADAQHYELVGWTSDATGIQFSYQGPMGRGSVGVPCGGIMQSHGSDPSWTGLDSAAPILAYIKTYGITSAIKESMNPTCFDPTVLQSLSAQGVSVASLGGPSSPTTGPNYEESHYPSSLKYLVGVNAPAPDFSTITSKSTPKPVSNSTPAPAPVQSKQPNTAIHAQPNTPVAKKSTTSGSSTSAQSQAPSQDNTQSNVKATIPDSTNKNVAATTGPVVPPKVVPPDLQKNTQKQNTSNWKIWLAGALAAIVVIGGGVFGFIKWKHRKYN